MPSTSAAPAPRHVGAGTFLLRLKAPARQRVIWLNFDCGGGVSRSIPVVTPSNSATRLLVRSGAQELSIGQDQPSGAMLSVIRVPRASEWLLRRIGRLAAKTGIGVGPRVFVQKIRGSALPPAAPIEHVVLDTPRLATLEAFGVSVLRGGTIDRDLIGAWPPAPDTRHAPAERPAAPVGVVVHLHYRDVWPEIEWFLRNIPFAFRLVVSLTEPEQPGDPALRARIGSVFQHAQVRSLPNRGRDIAPFLTLLKDGALADCPILCKIHGKKSADGSGEDLVGRLWRRRCMLDLLGNAERVREAVSLLVPGSDVGMVGPQALLHSSEDTIRPSKEALNRGVMRKLLANRGAGAVPLEGYEFFAGTMFWVRRDALQLVEALELAEQDFPEEPAPGNGTTSHAVERLFGVSVRRAGLRLSGLGEVDAGSAKDGLQNR
jgi:hypothetical protein